MPCIRDVFCHNDEVTLVRVERIADCGRGNVHGKLHTLDVMGDTDRVAFSAAIAISVAYKDIRGGFLVVFFIVCRKLNICVRCDCWNETRMTEHAAAAVREKDTNSLVAAHSTGPGNILKFDEAEILARSDHRVSRELLESCFSRPQSAKKRNNLPFP
ncbi:unnamed protein product [Dibothriocephalus latus]|uniref:Uncharacterized protein n=1 Tax=Dibothriocephalus latus TaxID=60516 RepID=A0A3P7L8T7_DIBLA|nr:unnamed protein product [Dibothriocephalus latus]